MKPGELIPALIVLLFIVAGVGLVFQLLLAAASGRRTDPVAVGALATILTTCLPIMVTLYLKDSSK